MDELKKMIRGILKKYIFHKKNKRYNLILSLLNIKKK